MITYEYICKSCGHTWEQEQGINDEPITKCPKCEEETAQRLISNGNGFILKGGGWFRTGY
jgi:putative FmdB family regulatory protein